MHVNIISDYVMYRFTGVMARHIREKIAGKLKDDRRTNAKRARNESLGNTQRKGSVRWVAKDKGGRLLESDTGRGRMEWVWELGGVGTLMRTIMGTITGRTIMGKGVITITLECIVLTTSILDHDSCVDGS